jgi:selenocysteine lyase/cysteine desulfurase
MLYVRKEKIKDLYPLFANGDPKSEDVKKFESLGTRPFFIEQATGKAVEFYDMIGAQRKEQRLLYLKNYWMEKVKNIPKVKTRNLHETGIRLRHWDGLQLKGKSLQSLRISFSKNTGYTRCP